MAGMDHGRETERGGSKREALSFPYRPDPEAAVGLSLRFPFCI